jgi:hypothetical protein
LGKEERILFPYVRALVKASETGDVPHVAFGSVENPIRVMTDENDTEGAFRENSVFAQRLCDSTLCLYVVAGDVAKIRRI